MVRRLRDMAVTAAIAAAVQLAAVGVFYLIHLVRA